MGIVLAVVEIAAIITTAILAAETIAIEVLQEQIRNTINSHQAQFDALKRLQVLIGSLIRKDDFQTIKKMDQLQKNVITQNLTEVQNFLSFSHKNLQNLITKFPTDLMSMMIPSQEDIIQILSTNNPAYNQKKIRYLVTKSLDKHQKIPFTKFALDITKNLKDVDWKHLGELLQKPALMLAGIGIQIGAFNMQNFIQGMTFLKSGAFQAFTSILSIAAFAYNIISIVDSTKELIKLVKQKDQIQKSLDKLPRSQVDILNAIKASLNTFLVYIIVSGSFQQHLKENMEFVFKFSSDQVLKKQLEILLTKMPNASTLIPISVIEITTMFSQQLQKMYEGGINEGNARFKLLQIDALFEGYFKMVDVDGIHEGVTKVFNISQSPYEKCMAQNTRLKHINMMLDQVINILSQDDEDAQNGKYLQIRYKQIFNKTVLDSTDKQLIVQCIATVRTKFYGDDQSGLTYLGVPLNKFKVQNLKYADIDNIEFGVQDITAFQTVWTQSHMKYLTNILSRAIPIEKEFSYQSTHLSFATEGTLKKATFSAKKIILFYGDQGSYQLICPLSNVDNYTLVAVQKQNGKSTNSFTRVNVSALNQNQTLKQGEWLDSGNGFYAMLRKNGTLAICKRSQDGYRVIWQTNRKPGYSNPYQLTINSKGDVILFGTYFSKEHQQVWSLPNNSSSLILPLSLSLLEEGTLALTDGRGISFATTPLPPQNIDNLPIENDYDFEFPKVDFPSELSSAHVLEQGQWLSSGNGFYALMQFDGNFVIYKGRSWTKQNAIWASNSNGRGRPPYFARLQQNIGLVIYGQGQPLYKLPTFRNGSFPYVLKMQRDSNLVITDSNGVAIGSANSQTIIEPTFLKQGTPFKQNYWLQYGSSYLVLRDDGNLVIYNSQLWIQANVIWSTKTAGEGRVAPYYLDFDTDGSLVLYGGDFKMWRTDLQRIGTPPYQLWIRKYTNEPAYLLITDSHSTVLWNSNSGRSTVFDNEIPSAPIQKTRTDFKFGQTMTLGEYLQSGNGHFTNFTKYGVLQLFYNTVWIQRKLVWSTSYHFVHNIFTLLFEPDGSLVIQYDKYKQHIYNHQKGQEMPVVLRLRKDGNLVILDQHENLLFQTKTITRPMKSTLQAGSTLKQGYWLDSGSQSFAVLSEDGDLLISQKKLAVLSTSKPFWSTNIKEKGSGPFELRLKENGQLFIVNGTGRVIWRASYEQMTSPHFPKRTGTPPYQLQLNKDQLVILDASIGGALWSTKYVK